MSVFFPFINEIVIYFEKGERYLKKEETIKKWMDRDRAKIVRGYKQDKKYK